MQNELSALQTQELLATLKTRFEEHMHRHQNIAWGPVLEKIKSNSTKLWSL